MVTKMLAAKRGCPKTRCQEKRLAVYKIEALPDRYILYLWTATFRNLIKNYKLSWLSHAGVR